MPKKHTPKPMFSLKRRFGGDDGNGDPIIAGWRALKRDRPELGVLERATLLAISLPPALDAASVDESIVHRRVDEVYRHLGRANELSDEEIFEGNELERRVQVERFADEVREGIFNRESVVRLPNQASVEPHLEELTERAWKIVNREFGGEPFWERVFLTGHLLLAGFIGPDVTDMDDRDYAPLAESMIPAVCGWLEKNQDHVLSASEIKQLAEAKEPVSPANG